MTEEVTLEAPGIAVEEWKGKVLGSEKDIINALKYLKRKPKSIRELQTTIFEIRKEEISEVAEISRNSFY